MADVPMDSTAHSGDGTPAPLGPTQFTIPPTQQNNIGLLLSKHHVSRKYYGEGFDGGKEDGEAGTFCNICDPFLYSTQIMTNPTLRANNQDIKGLYNDIQNNTLPAVSIVKPDGLPGSAGHDLQGELTGTQQHFPEVADSMPRPGS